MKKSELELLKKVVWMGYLWAQSLRDAGAEYKRDMKAAEKAYSMLKEKLKQLSNGN